MPIAEAVFPGAVDAALLWARNAQKAGIPLVAKKVPDDGYFSNVWNVAPFVGDYMNGRPVQDQMYTIFYQTGAEWNATRFSNAEFDALLLKARAETDLAERKAIYSKMAHIFWDEGGAVIPVFNDFIDGHSSEVEGWIDDPNAEMMGGYFSSKTWFA